MDAVSEQGWVWAHNVLNPILSDAAKDVALCAVLIAYRAGLRQGYADLGGEAPIEVEYSDSDIVDQMNRFDEGLALHYNWPIASRERV